MDELLKELGIPDKEDLSVIKEKLEQMQVEHLDRLNNVEDENRRKQLKENLLKIENALSQITWMQEKLNKGLVPTEGISSKVNQESKEKKINVESLKSEIKNDDQSIKQWSNIRGNNSGSIQSGKSNNSIISPKLQRAFICLEHGDWNKADSLIEDVLNEDPTCSKAYVGKLMADLHIFDEKKLMEHSSLLTGNQNYLLALKYATSDYARILKGYNDYIEQSIEYKSALKNMLNARNEDEYAQTAKEFDKLSNFQDSAQKASECRKKINDLKQVEIQRRQNELEKYYQEAVYEMKKNEYVRTVIAINIFSTRDGLENYKDVPQLLKQCESVLTEQKYIAAIELMNQGTYESAVKFFSDLEDYKDSRNQKLNCEKIIQRQKNLEKKNEKKRKRKNNFIGFAILFVPIFIVIIVITNIKSICLYSGISDNGTLVKYHWFAYGTQKIPESVYGKKITTIGSSAFSRKKGLNKIILQDGIKNIEKEAFIYCYNLTEISLPEGLNNIEDGTFSGCKSLKEMTIPEGIRRIGSQAFRGCHSIKELILPKSLSSIGSDAFMECSSLKEITIPEGTSSIGDQAFYKCINLKEITLSQSLTSIGSSIFLECDGLKAIKVYRDSYAAEYFKEDSRLVYID